MNEHPAWIIFYGTLTTTVRAASEDLAFVAFLRATDGRGEDDDERVWNGRAWERWGDYRRGRFGRLVPPTRSEVTIRRPAERDRGWIEDSRDPAFLALLPELVDA